MTSSTLTNNHANSITASTWFVDLYNFKPLEDSTLSSKLKLYFLQDSGAFIGVLNFPTSTKSADEFLKSLKSTPSKTDFKTLRVTNKAEVPIVFNIILTLHTSIHGSTRTIVIQFAVAIINWDSFGQIIFLGLFSLINI